MLLSKKIQALILSTGVLSSLAQAETILVSALKPVILNKVKANKIEIAASYPGSNLSGVCNLSITTEQSSGNLLPLLAERLKIVNVFSLDPVTVNQVGYGALRIDLLEDSYVDGIRITTKDGKSIASNIRAVTGDRDTLVGVASGVCN